MESNSAFSVAKQLGFVFEPCRGERKALLKFEQGGVWGSFYWGKKKHLQQPWLGVRWRAEKLKGQCCRCSKGNRSRIGGQTTGRFSATYKCWSLNKLLGGHWLKGSFRFQAVHFYDTRSVHCTVYPPIKVRPSPVTIN